MNSFLRNASALALAIYGAGSGAAFAAQPPARVVDPLSREALLTPRAAQSTLLGVALAGQRLVAVGERGVVLFSDDNGASWHQAQTPVSVTLTVVRFIDATRGWAAGHNGVLLQTVDGGTSWQRVLDGRDVVALYQQQAEKLASRFGENEEKVRRARRHAEQLTADGPDKPWLDMNIDSAGRLWLVGAYGMALHSRDGSVWEPWSANLDNPKDLHLYAIKSQGDEVFIAGEQGLLLRSTDAGQSFQRLASPYKGSFFVLELHDNEILIGGLRGFAFRSADRGSHFEPITLPAPISVTGSLRLQDGETLLVDQSGSLYRLNTGRLQKIEGNAGSNPSALVEAANGALVGVGRFGPLNISALAHP